MSDEAYARKFLEGVIKALRDGQAVSITPSKDGVGNEWINVSLQGKKTHPSGKGRPRKVQGDGARQFGPGSLHRRKFALVKALQEAEAEFAASAGK